MNKYFILIFLTIQIGTLKAQNNEDQTQFSLNPADHYILKVDLSNTMFNANFVCQSQNTPTYLYTLNVKQVIYSAEDNTIDSASLSNLKYILVPKEYLDSLKPATEYIISARPSRSKSYLLFNRCINENLSNYSFHQDRIFYGLLECRGYDPFEAYIRSLNK